MTPPNVNPSPKSRFITSKHWVDAHRELIVRLDFRLALETSQAQMIWDMSGGSVTSAVNGNEAAANFYKLQGVHEFIRIFLTLAEQPAQMPQQDMGGIDHTFK
jgi:hypothetical protein